jgi:hypothetical protein
MPQITSTVGLRGVNQQNDVRLVQGLLNQFAPRLGAPALLVDGRAGDRTVAAIKLFQQKVAGMALPDGRVDPGSLTWRALTGAGAPPRQAVNANRLSGAAWWHANQGRYPNSADIAALDGGFKPKVDKFLVAMKAAGLKVTVRSTRRSKVRAYLMHYSWKVAKGTTAPDQVPAEPGCDIVWDHGDPAASRRAAQQMVELFGVVYQPSLNSRHIAGLAIDMDIQWAGAASIRNAQGTLVTLGAPCEGASNTELHKVGASYGVIKNIADRPHWSDNGH